MTWKEEGLEIQRGNREDLIQKMRDAGITGCIEPAIDVDSNELLLDLCGKYPGFLYPAVGNHPTRCTHSSLGDFRRIREYVRDRRVVAIGETGLDYHDNRKVQHRFRQKVWFCWQIRLADSLELPLILHIREAHTDAIRILRRNRKKLHGGVCHCFAGDRETARIYTGELNLALGIGGMLLMKKEISDPLRDVVSETPLEYLLLETDGPFVKPEKPEGFSRKQWEKARNTSLILPAVAAEIAKIKGLSVTEVQRATEENAKRIFYLPG